MTEDLMILRMRARSLINWLLNAKEVKQLVRLWVQNKEWSAVVVSAEKFQWLLLVFDFWNKVFPKRIKTLHVSVNNCHVKYSTVIDNLLLWASRNFEALEVFKAPWCHHSFFLNGSAQVLWDSPLVWIITTASISSLPWLHKLGMGHQNRTNARVKILYFRFLVNNTSKTVNNPPCVVIIFSHLWYIFRCCKVLESVIKCASTLRNPIARSF